MIPQGHGEEGGGVAVPTAQGSSSVEPGSPPTKLPQHPGLSGSPSRPCPGPAQAEHLPLLRNSCGSSAPVPIPLPTRPLKPHPSPLLNIWEGRGPLRQLFEASVARSGRHPPCPTPGLRRTNTPAWRRGQSLPGRLPTLPRRAFPGERTAGDLQPPQLGELSVYSSTAAGTAGRQGLLPSPRETEARGA